MLVSCRYCSLLHQRGERCPARPSNSGLKKGNTIDSFHWSSIWKRTARAIKQRDKYLCQICLTKQYNTLYQYNYKLLEVHHITALKNDYNKRLDRSNLITLCKYHHIMADDGTIPKNKLFAIANNNELYYNA